MGPYGCDVVKGHGRTQKQGKQREKWLCRARFGPYDRGISPRHYVLGCLTKSDADGCRWVYIDSDGCGWMHGQWGKQKQDEKNPEWANRGCFVMYGRGKKNREGDRNDHDDQRGPRGAIEGEQGVCSPIKMYLGNENTRKQT